jgi:L-alanine-DL-glutamate epimerase-like enolase superfamily enzyme
MRIKKVQSWLLSCPLPEPLKLSYYGGERTILKRDAMLIRVDTDAGLVGYAPGEGSEKAQQIIQDRIAPFLESHMLADPDALRVLFMKNADAVTARVYSAVEIALYDVLGKAYGAPVSELLGGRLRDRIQLYGSAGMYMTPEKYAEEAAAITDLGFHAYKMRLGLGPDEDIRAIELMREAVGPDIDLMVDAHTWWRMGDRSYNEHTVQRVAQSLAEHGAAWLEEPLPPDDYDAYRRLKEKDFLPLAAGEHELSDAGFSGLIAGDCVDYVQMDLTGQGGYPTGRRICSDIMREGLRFAFHSWGTALEVVAAAHLGITFPETVAEWLEYPMYASADQPGMYAFPLAEEILTDPLQIERGNFVVSTEPGLGVAVDESVIEKYPWIPGPWSYFSLISPKETWAVTADHSVKWAGK